MKKKIIIILAMVLLPLYVYSQMLGGGGGGNAYTSTLTSDAQDQIDAQMTSAEHTTKVGAAYDTEDELKLLMSITQAQTDTAGAVTPTLGYKEVDLALTGSADNIAIVLSEAGPPVANSLLIITNVHTNTLTFADSAGVQELTGGAATLEQFESITFRYMTDRWVEIARSTNAMSFSTIQAGMKILIDADIHAASNVLTAAQMNSVLVMTEAGDVMLPDVCDSATGAWITIKSSAAHLNSVDVTDTAGDDFVLSDGTNIDGDANEVDLAGGAGDQATFMCIQTGKWWVMGEIGTVIDGGAND